MSLGILPALIGAAAALAPTIYSIVDDQQRRKKERKDQARQQMEAVRVEHYQNAGIPAVQIPDAPVAQESGWPSWALPVAITGGVILFGSAVLMAVLPSGEKKREPRSKKHKKLRKHEDHYDEVEEDEAEE